MRRPDWRDRLVTYCAAVEHEPFAYGTSDCFTFANGAVEAMTGRDLFPQFTGYASRFGMLRMLIRHGYRSVLDATQQAMTDSGWPAILEAEASPGDVVVLPGEPLHSLAIVWEGGVLARTLDGLALVPHGHALATWKVP